MGQGINGSSVSNSPTKKKIKRVTINEEEGTRCCFGWFSKSSNTTEEFLGYSMIEKSEEKISKDKEWNDKKNVKIRNKTIKKLAGW